MKRVILSLTIVVVLALGANAQKSSSSSEGFKIGIGPRVGLPVGNLGDFYSFAIGGELQGEYMFSPNASATVATGYTNFIGKTINGFKVGSSGLIPILVGARYYPSTQFFVGGRLGLSISTETGGGSDFTYEPQVGYNGERFQLALGYNAISGSGSTSAHLGLTGIIKLN